jgi:hypothetical protein
MRRSVVALVLGSMGALLLAGPAVEACGDKLLSIARGIRLQQVYKAQHPSRLLMYVGEVREERAVVIEMSILFMSLRQAGHRVDVAQSASELNTALESARYAFVLADARDVPAVAIAVASRGGGAALLPVLFEPGAGELAVAEAEFPLVLKTPARSTDHLEAIDRAVGAMATRAD